MKTIRTIMLLCAALAVSTLTPVVASASTTTSITPGEAVTLGTFTVTFGTVTGYSDNNYLPAPSPQNTTITATENSPTSISITVTGDFGVEPTPGSINAGQSFYIPYTMTLGAEGNPYDLDEFDFTATNLAGFGQVGGGYNYTVLSDSVGGIAIWYTPPSFGTVTITEPAPLIPGCQDCDLEMASDAIFPSTATTTFSSATFTFDDTRVAGPEPATGVLWGVGIAAILVLLARSSRPSQGACMPPSRG